MDHKATKLLQRLKRIEGQVRGVQRMIEEERYCIDILQQLAAIKAATDQVGLALLENHMQGCLRKAIQNGEGHEQISEIMNAVRQFVK